MKFAKEIFAILCDDIRQELGGKVSLMGIYGRDLVVPDIPFMLPKLCLWISIKEIKNDLGQMKVVITSPASEPLSIILPPPPRQKLSKDIQLGMAFAPLNIKGEGMATIEVFQNDEDIPFFLHNFNIIKTKSPQIS